MEEYENNKKARGDFLELFYYLSETAVLRTTLIVHTRILNILAYLSNKRSLSPKSSEASDNLEAREGEVIFKRNPETI